MKRSKKNSFSISFSAKFQVSKQLDGTLQSVKKQILHNRGKQ